MEGIQGEWARMSAGGSDRMVILSKLRPAAGLRENALDELSYPRRYKVGDIHCRFRIWNAVGRDQPGANFA